MTAEDLRKAILQQAIQGKLVPQDPNDEPASVLLERIREEKARLVKEKKIKKDKNESIIYRGEDNSHYEKFADGTVKCIDEEIPFEIPNTWIWCRISNVIKLLSGRDLTPNQYNSNAIGVPYMTGASNFFNGELIINRWTPSPVTISQKGDLLITCKGTIGEMAYNNVGEIHIARQIMSISTDYMELSYIKIFLSTLISELNAKAKSMIPGISRENILDTIIPIPPLNEQKRIAQRIEEIQPLIDKYRIAQEQAEEMDKSLNGLLKKSILQYAIQGKLLPQNSNEEPASALLEKIQQEKLKLVKEGKLKKKDLDNGVIYKGDDNKYFEKKGNDVVCIDDEIPFEIPDNWEWTRLGNCCTLIGGYAFKSHEIKSLFGHRVIRISDISDEGLINNNIVRYNGTLDLSKYQIVNNDILIAMTGGTVGKSMFFSSKSNDVLLLNQRVAIIRSNLILPQYIYVFIKSPYIKEIIDNAKNSTNDNISMADISGFLIPLPPLDEQKRIVKALDNVLASIMRN